MNIGILGGTFNPVHFGHIYMASKSKEVLGLEQIFFMPNYIPPHKESAEVSAEDRLQMLRLALEDFPEFSISTYEIDKEGVSYTYETLEELHRRHPLDSFFFIIGEDSYVNFWRWKHPERILQAARIVVLQREGYSDQDAELTEQLLKEHQQEAILISAEPLDISSSTVREKIMRDEDVTSLVPFNVLAYIRENHLYQCIPWPYEKLQAFVEENVKPSRYLHIQGVIEAAVELTRLHGGEEKAVRLAALCHDMLKDKETPWLLDLIRRFGEDPGDGMLSPQILHAQAGALYLSHVCCIWDQEVLDAIRYHTTGRPQMDHLEKILFVADYIEKNREFPGVEVLRELARIDLDRAIYEALNGTIIHLNKQGMVIAENSLKARDYYKKITEERIRNE